MNAVRRWSVMELQSIEDDLVLMAELIEEEGIRGVTPHDAAWISSRIETRALNGTFGPGRCDSCGITGQHLRIYVDEMHDGFGSPPDLSITHLCVFCR